MLSNAKPKIQYSILFLHEKSEPKGGGGGFRQIFIAVNYHPLCPSSPIIAIRSKSNIIFVAVMKMGNIAYVAGFELTRIALWDGVLTITPPKLPDIISLPTPTCLCGSLPLRSVHTIT